MLKRTSGAYSSFLSGLTQFVDTIRSPMFVLETFLFTSCFKIINNTSLRPLLGDIGRCGLCVVGGYSGDVQLWPPPGKAVGFGLEPPVSRLWKIRVRVPLSKLATSGCISNSAFWTGDSRCRTSSCEQEKRRDAKLRTEKKTTTKFTKTKITAHSAESHVECWKVLQSGHGLESTKVLHQPVLTGLVLPHTTCKNMSVKVLSHQVVVIVVVESWN